MPPLSGHVLKLPIGGGSQEHKIKNTLEILTDLDEDPMQDNVHRIITHEFPRYFALVSRPKVTFHVYYIFKI